MAPLAKRIVLGQTGFTLGLGAAFNDQNSATRIYAALLGDDIDSMPTKAELWQRGGETLTNLFRAVIEQSALFMALRGSDLVWQMIVARANLFDDISVADARILVNKMAALRNSDFPSTELARLVDEYVALRNTTDALGPASTFQLAHRGHTDSSGSGSNSEATDRPVDDLTATLGSLSISFSSSWPLPQFVLGDLSVLAHRHVREALQSEAAVALPGAQSVPLDVMTAVARIAVTHYETSSPWAIFLSPVAYVNNPTRRSWYPVAGWQARLFAAWDHFLEYANDAFTKRGKQVVMGLVLYWQGMPSDFDRLANIHQTDAQQLWETANFLRRHGTLFIMRRVPVDGGLQIIWFDPWKTNNTIQAHYKPRQMAIFNFRAGVVDRITRWATENNIRIHSRYWGGYNVTGVTDDDSVKMSLTLLDWIAAGRFTLPESQEDLEDLGYVRTE
ncbi:hypothetical protein V8F06_004199 [Rhypophila decipiens]